MRFPIIWFLTSLRALSWTSRSVEPRRATRSVDGRLAEVAGETEAGIVADADGISSGEEKRGKFLTGGISGVFFCFRTGRIYHSFIHWTSCGVHHGSTVSPSAYYKNSFHFIFTVGIRHPNFRIGPQVFLDIKLITPISKNEIISIINNK